MGHSIWINSYKKEDVEKCVIDHLLSNNRGWTIKQYAKELNISERTLFRLLVKYKIKHDRRRKCKRWYLITDNDNICTYPNKTIFEYCDGFNTKCFSYK